VERTYTVILREEPEGSFTVLVPALPEIVTYGKTVEHAKKVAAEAIRCAILGRQDLGEPAPDEDPVLSVPEAERTGKLFISRVSCAPVGEAARHA
jgi:antitoxin HicB